MVARLQQLMVVGLVLLALGGGWAIACIAEPASSWFWAWPLLLLPHAPVLAMQFVLLATVGRDEQVPRPSAGQFFSAWWAELWCALRVFAWRQPFCASRWPDVPGRPGVRGLLLVHGYFCNRGLWGPWLQRLTGQGQPFTALTLGPAFGSIDAYADAIDIAVRQLQQQTDLAPVVVAHSMGGLAVRAWLAGRDDGTGQPGQAAVHAVVTVGSPHQGTWLARFAHTGNGRQMRRGNPWLAALAHREAELRATQAGAPALAVPWVCFYGHADNIVFPASTAMLPGANNQHLIAVPHVQMLFHAQVWQTVTTLLEEVDPPASVLV